MTEILILSTHDYRSHRRVNVHFIAEAASTVADRVSFFSMGVSVLSLVKNDPRKSLLHRANKWEREGAVDCFLWKTPLHPINLKGSVTSKMVAHFYRDYARWNCPELDERARSASVIMMESGLSPIFIKRL